MADYFFRYLLFLFLIIIIWFGVEGYTHDDGCKVSKCGENGPPIRFPFRLISNQPKHCGYPGFELSCNHKNQTVLQLPVAFKAVVKRIDYKDQSILIQDPHNCFPAQLQRLNFSASPFYDNYSYTEFDLFNCSPAERNAGHLVHCVSRPGYQVYAVSYDDLSDEFTYCVKFCNFSSIPYDFFDFLDNDESYTRLRWEEPNCGNCERDGNLCRWKNYNTTAPAAGGGEPELLECVQMPKTTTGASKKFHLTAAAKKRVFSVLGAILLSLVVIALYLIITL